MFKDFSIKRAEQVASRLLDEKIKEFMSINNSHKGALEALSYITENRNEPLYTLNRLDDFMYFLDEVITPKGIRSYFAAINATHKPEILTSKAMMNFAEKLGPVYAKGYFTALTVCADLTSDTESKESVIKSLTRPEILTEEVVNFVKGFNKPIIAQAIFKALGKRATGERDHSGEWLPTQHIIGFVEVARLNKEGHVYEFTKGVQLSVKFSFKNDEGPGVLVYYSNKVPENYTQSQLFYDLALLESLMRK